MRLVERGSGGDSSSFSAFLATQWQAGSYCLTRGGAHAPAVGAQNLTTGLWGSSSDSMTNLPTEAGRLSGGHAAQPADHRASAASLLPEDIVMGSRADENLGVCLPLVLTSFSFPQQDFKDRTIGRN